MTKPRKRSKNEYEYDPDLTFSIVKKFHSMVKYWALTEDSITSILHAMAREAIQMTRAKPTARKRRAGK